MRIFDFLKRKPSSHQPTSDAIGASDGPSFHYAFAHYALRQTALAEPLQVLAILASPEANLFLTDLLVSIEDQFGTAAPFSADQLRIHAVSVANYPCAVIELPKPAQTAEAYFVALVTMIELDSENQSPVEDDAIPSRYFTLEKSAAIDGVGRTVFAEWSDSSHLNYGDGPEPKLEPFLERIADMMGDQ